MEAYRIEFHCSAPWDTPIKQVTRIVSAETIQDAMRYASDSYPSLTIDAAAHIGRMLEARIPSEPPTTEAEKQ